jgi:hypothetical protein
MKIQETLKHVLAWIKARRMKIVGTFDVTKYSGNKLFLLPAFVFSWDERSELGYKFAFIIAFGQKYYRWSFGPIIESLKDTL